MKATITYGEKSLSVEAESFHIAPPNQVDNQDGKTVLSHSVDNPVDSDPLSSFVEDEFLIVVNDAQRPTFSSAVLKVVLDRTPHDNFSIAVATGSHAPPNEKELTYIFGEYYPQLKEKIHIHKALETPHDYYGTTSRKTEVFFDPIIQKYSKIVVIGSVEPHYFAGYSGGRKGFLPGLAAYKTIEQNHKFALEKEAKNLALKGNPVHEDMEEAVKFIPKDIFAMNMVLNQYRQVFACSSGNIFSSLYEAVRQAEKVYCVPAPKRDIVLAVAPYPLDVNLYQAQKAIENGKIALNDGGILILVAQCRNGIGPDTFYQLLKKSSTPQDALDSLKEGYKLGYHKAGKIAELTTRAQIWAVTDLEPDILRDVFMKPVGSVQQAIDDAIEEKGGEVLVLPEASMTVPLCDL